MPRVLYNKAMTDAEREETRDRFRADSKRFGKGGRVIIQAHFWLMAEFHDAALKRDHARCRKIDANIDAMLAPELTTDQTVALARVIVAEGLVLA